MENNADPKIVIYTNSDTSITLPLIDKGLNIIGIAEDSDKFYSQHLIIRMLIKLYWRIFKWKPFFCNSNLTKKHNINYIAIGDAKSVEFKSWLKKLSPDIMLVYLTPILDKEVFSIPKYGTVNLHPSLLPHYRGPHPIFWMYYNFDLNTGSTLHYIDEGVDTGQIIDQASFSIKLGMTEADTTKIAIDKYGVDMFVKFVKNQAYLSQGENKKIDNVLDADSIKPYAHRLSSDEYFQCIDFENWTLERTWNFLRCIDTWKLKFQKSEKIDSLFELGIEDYKQTNTNYRPGQFVREGARLFITHKDGVISITRKLSVIKYLKSIVRKYLKA